MSKVPVSTKEMWFAGARVNMPEIMENGLPFQGRLSFLKGISLFEFVTGLNARVNESGRIITLFKLNGQEYELSNIPKGLALADNDKIDFKSASPIELAKQSMDEVVSQLSDFDSVIDAIINSLIKGERDEAFKKFGGFIDEFRDIIRCLETVESTFGLDYSKIQAGEKTIRETTESMMKILSEIKGAMQNEDYVTLTDLLEYEIREIFKKDLKSVFEELSRILADG